jgi:hypothetical protein
MSVPFPVERGPGLRECDQGGYARPFPLHKGQGIAAGCLPDIPGRADKMRPVANFHHLAPDTDIIEGRGGEGKEEAGMKLSLEKCT